MKTQRLLTELFRYDNRMGDFLEMGAGVVERKRANGRFRVRISDLAVAGAEEA